MTSSTGMHDDCMKTLIDCQEGPLGYSVPCSILATAVNNHETLTYRIAQNFDGGKV